MIKVVHFGLGPIGQGIARLILQTPGLRITGATDPAPHMSGLDLGNVLGLGRRLRLRVDDEPERFIKKLRADVAVLTTSSSFKLIKKQIADLVARRINIITTCEELAYPSPKNQAAFRQLDRLAKQYKVSVLATGVNPGYAMDSLALMLTAPCARVDRIAVTRVVDAATRRLPLQRKVGVGLSLSQFRRAVGDGDVGHVGLGASAHMIAGGLGWKLDRIDETLEPSVAPRDLETDHLRVPAGAAAGVRQTVRGYRNGQLAINLELQMYVGAVSPRDHVLIDGTPPINMTVEGGIDGDIATAAIIVNAIPRLLAARAGLLTMLDVPLTHHFNPAQLKGLPRKKTA
jgi:4-hydroxy-tetrahydrodipicolinate reductase